MLNDQEKDFRERLSIDDLLPSRFRGPTTTGPDITKARNKGKDDKGEEKEERVLDTEQAAELLGIAKGNVYKKLHTGELPC